MLAVVNYRDCAVWMSRAKMAEMLSGWPGAIPSLPHLPLYPLYVFYFSLSYLLHQQVKEESQN